MAEVQPNNTVVAAGTQHSNRAIIDQLRFNTNLEHEEVRSIIDKKMLTNMFNDEKLLEMTIDATLSEVRKDLDNKVNQKNVFVYQKVSKEDQMKLKKHFWMFNLDFTRATDTSGHSFWRACRLLSEKKMLHESRVNTHSKPINGRDVVYKDVGGNPTTHVNRDEQYVHTCSPVLSNNDDKRKSAYKEALRRRSRYDTSLAYRMHLAQDSQVICENKSQHCKINSELLILLHSSYDMSPEDIAQSMHQANALTARGCFHFNPRVVFEDSGELSNGLFFKKFIRNNRIYIRFFFADDNQEGYEHDYLNYLALLRTFRITSVVGDEKRYYNVQFETTEDDVAYFTIRRSINGHIPACSPYRVFTNQAFSDKFILYYWHWETLNTGTFFSSLKNHMKPSRIVVPKKLFHKLISFADTLPESKFTVKNILIAGTSFNTREVISGQNVGNPDPIDSTDMKNLAHAVFLLTYISNFECTKTLSTLINQEEDVRQLSEKIYARRWFSKQLRRVIRAIGFGSEKHNYDVYNFSEKLEDGNCVTTSFLKAMLKSFREEASVEREFEVCVNKRMCQFMTVEEELDALMIDEQKVDRGYTSENELNRFVNSDIVHESLLQTLTREKTVNTYYCKDNLKVELCLSELEVVENRSNGHCVFQSLIDAGMYNCSVIELRRKLASCPSLEMLKDSFDQRKLLNIIDGSVEGFGSTETLILASLDTSVGICIHTNGRCKSFGPQPRKHFLFQNNHCSFMKPVHSFEHIPTVEVDLNMNFPVDFCADGRKNAYVTFMNSDNPTKTKFRKNLQIALNACWPMSELGTGNYVSRDGLRCAEVFERFFATKSIDSCLVVGGPGGEVQYLAENKQCRIFGIADVEKLDFYASIDYPCFTQLFGYNCDGTIQSERDIFSYRNSIREEFRNGVDHFIATGLESHSNESVETNSVALGWKILLAFVTLRRGGDAVFAVDDFIQHSNYVHFSHLIKNFRDVRVVKLETSRPTNTEFHVICKGFLRSTRPKEYFANGLDTVDDRVKNFCLHTQKYFDNVLMNGLSTLRKTLNTVGTKNFRINKFGAEVLEGYKNKLCLNDTESAGSFSKVVRFVRRVYNTAVDATRNFREELDNGFDDDMNLSVEDWIDIENEYSAIVDNESTSDISESDSFHTAVCEEPIVEQETAIVSEKKKKTKNKLVSFAKKIFDRKKNDVTFTEMGKTNDLGIKQLDVQCIPKPVFSIAEKRVIAAVSTHEARPVVEEKEETEKDTVESTEKAGDAWDYKDSMREFVELTKCTLESEISNHNRILNKLSRIPAFNTIITCENGNYKYAEVIDGGYRIIAQKEGGPAKYNKFFHNGCFKKMEEMENLVNGEKILLSDYCEIAIESEILSSIGMCDIDNFVMPECSIVQAAAGCGKTTFIVNNSVPPHMPGAATILLSTCEGRDDYIARIERKYKVELNVSQKKYVRTLASYLVNAGGKNGACEELFVDEALMAHPGAVCFAILMSGAKKVRMLGDMLQIPYVNRTPSYITKYCNLQHIAPVTETLYTSYRCPADVCKRLDAKYLEFNRKNGVDKGMRAVRNIGNTCVYRKINNEIIPIDKDWVYLTFTQADKKKVAMKAPNCHVSTVHEFQGKEAKKVRVIRFDTFKTTEIFNRENYALVALTRHTEALEYYTRVTDDALSKMIGVDEFVTFQKHTDDEIAEIMVDAAGDYAGIADAFQYAVPVYGSTFSVIPVTKKHIGSVDGNRMYFVPRFGRKKSCFSKPNVMHRDAIVRRRGQFFDIFCVSSDHFEQKHNLTSMRKSLKVLNGMLEDFGLTHIYVDSTCENDVERSSVAYLLRKNLRCSSTLCSTDKNYDTPTEVFDLLTKNGMNELANSEYECVPVFDIRCDFDQKISYPFNHAYAQKFIDNCFGECAMVDQTFDAWHVKNTDLELELGDIAYLGTSADYREKYDCMRPTLHTPMPIQRDFTCRELMIAMEKRNRNVPNMNGTVDFELCSQRMLDKVVQECFDSEKLAIYNHEPITISHKSVGDWLAGQDECVKNMIVPDFALHNLSVNNYNFSIKRKPKPNLTVDATSSYLALQTIVYHEKSINAMFCSVFRELKSRIRNVLRSNIKIFSDKSPQEFEEELDRDIPVASLGEVFEKLEVDISKYDKSQRELALEYEVKLMRFFKVDEDIIQLWYHAHILTSIYDKVCKIRALVPYQRKSGDASTFLGNTMFLLAVLADRIPLSQMLMVLVAGDDSLIYGHKLDQYKDTQHFGLKFNLEIKFFTFDRSYFCSKFLLPVDGKWTFTPDPLKLLTKMGRCDLINPEHVEEYRISCKDAVKNFSDIRICSFVSEAVRERYGIINDYTPLFASLPTMCNKSEFSSLFYTLPCDNIDINKHFSTNFD